MTSTPSLQFEPSANFAFIEAPIFSEMETRKAVAVPPARALVDPGDRYLQELGNFLDAKESTPRRRHLHEFGSGRHQNTGSLNSPGNTGISAGLDVSARWKAAWSSLLIDRQRLLSIS